MSQISTHVLDTALGRPAVGVAVALERESGTIWTPLDAVVTDTDGRAASLGADLLDAGRYRLVFDTESYLESSGQVGFFPEVTVVFSVTGSDHLHVPLLLSPFGYSTYRGS